MSYPANLTNLLYGFAVERVAAAGNGDALHNADVQESDSDGIKPKTPTVRIGSYAAKPTEVLDGLKETNGSISIEFIVEPNSTKLPDRVLAREKAHQMAMEFAAAVFKYEDLNKRSCNCDVISKENGFRNIGTTRHQASVLNLVINPF